MKVTRFLLVPGLLMVSLSLVRAQPAPVPLLRVQVERQKATPSPCGLTIQGKIRNTGTQPLTYLQIVPLLSDRRGQVVYRGSGYLTVSPLLPGQSAEFRAYAADAPAFSHVSLALRESGQPVVVEVRQQVQRPALKVPGALRQAARLVIRLGLQT